VRIARMGLPLCPSVILQALCQPALPASTTILISGLLALLSEASGPAVDTEAMGLVMAAIVFAWSRSPMARDTSADPDCARFQRARPRLQQLMENPAIEKVFPLCPLRSAALGEGLGLPVNPLVRTQRGQPLAPHLQLPPRTQGGGFRSWVVWELDKQWAQSSDWGRVEGARARPSWPMPANDVALLAPCLWAPSRRFLEREERLELARRCFACIPVFSGTRSAAVSVRASSTEAKIAQPVLSRHPQFLRRGNWHSSRFGISRESSRRHLLLAA